MKQKRVKLIATILALVATVTIQAQTALPSSGSEAIGGGGSASYSVGQMVYTTQLGVNGSIAEGVQQPYEISIVSAIEGSSEINLVVSAYPNPTTDFLILNVTGFDESKLSCQLYDLSGNLLQNQKITSSETKIEMKTLAFATYLLKVTSNNKEIKTFKIIKK